MTRDNGSKTVLFKRQPSGERSRGPTPSLERPAAALPGSDGEEAPRDRLRRGRTLLGQEPASGGRERSSAAAAAPAEDPPFYQGGHNDIEKGRDEVIVSDEVGLHWATITGPEEDVPEVRALLVATFGNDMKAATGGGFYAGAWRWPQGVSFAIGHNQNGGFMVRVPGSACDLMGGPELWAFLQRLFLGERRCTRLDIYRDLRGENLRLIFDATASCHAGELCHARRFKPHDGRSAVGLDRLDHGLEIGSRSSARYIRIYDKGLESGTAMHGQWVRFELELKDDAAHECAQRLLRHLSYENGMGDALRFLVGVVDFRERNGDAHLERRPRVAWWDRFCGDIEGVRPRMEPGESDWQSKVAWIRSQVAPTIRAWAEVAGCEVAEMYAAVAAEVAASESALRDPATADIARIYGEIAIVQQAKKEAEATQRSRCREMVENR